MLLPLKDENPSRTFPFVMVTILSINVILFLYELLLPLPALERLVRTYGITPFYIFNPGLSPFNPGWLVYLTVFTSMFLHGGWSHLLGNMLFLWIFGNNVEEAEGRIRFLIFYFVAGIAAAFLQTVFHPASMIPSIGASGAIAGILGAYVVLFPRARVISIILPFIFLPLILPSYIVIGLWFVLQVFLGTRAIMGSLTAPVAFLAHIGGFVAGAALISIFKLRRFKVKDEYKW